MSLKSVRVFRWNKLLLIPLLLGAILVWLLWPQSSAVAGWFDDNWLYRVAISIGNTGSADANKKVKFDIDTATLISAGKMQSDCGDSRFTDAGGKILKYYLDGAGGACNGASTDYYILMESIPVGGSIIYHYYGNPSVQNGTQSSQFSQSTFSPNSGPTAATEEKSPGPVAAWSFDEGVGTVVHDSTSKQYDGIISGNVAWAKKSDCISGTCLKFDGTGGMVTITDPANGDLDPTNAMSFVAWIRPVVDGGEGTFGRILYGVGDTDIYVSGYANNFMGLCAKTQSVNDTCTSITEIKLNSWTHIAVVYVDNNTRNYYINGNLVASNDSNNPLNNLASNKYIGNLSSDNRTFNGFIDEMKVYNYGLSAAQIKADLAARGGTKGINTQFGNADTGKKLSDGLVGYWKMDENTGTSLADATGNGNTGSLGTGSSAPSWTAAKFGSGLNFDGTNDYVDLNDLIVATSNLTVSAWVYADTFSSANTIAQNGTCCGGGSWKLILESGLVTFGVSSDGSTEITTTTPSAISAAAWHHIVGVYTPGKKLEIYVDGQLTTTNSTNIPASQIDTAPLDIHLGRRNVSGGDNYFDGKIDEFRIYSRSLSGAEVKIIYNWAPAPNAYYNLDEHGGTTSIIDASGNGNTATLTGISSTDWVAGKFGSGLNFDMTDNYINAASPASLDNIFDGGGTISFWINPRSDGEGDTSYLMNKGEWIFWADSDITGLDLYFQHSFSGNCCSNWSWTNVLPTNAWAHLSVTYDNSSTSNAPTLYINGIPYTASVGSAPSGTRDTDASSSLRIGSNAGANTSDAVMDEIRIYDYTRTSAQIIEDMNGGHPIGGSPIGSQVGYWKLNEGYGTTAYDQSDNHNDITLSAARWTNSGKFGKAWDGSGVYVSRADDADFDFAAAEDFSVSFWFKSDSATNDSPAVYLVTKGTIDVSGTAGYTIYSSSGAGDIRFAIDDDGSWGSNAPNVLNPPDDTTGSTSDFYDATWHHVVATKTGTSRIDLYVDGKLRGSDTSISATGSLANNVSMYIGNDDTDVANSFSGDIDELKIYRAALTAEQVLIEYNQGQSTIMGATSTASDGITADNSSAREYCVPGDTTSCSAPVGEWKFDEKTGTVARDSSGNGNDGTITNSRWTSAKIGGGLSSTANGSQEVVTITDPASGTLDFTNSNDYTISTWAKLSNTEGLNPLITKGFDLNPAVSGYSLISTIAGGAPGQTGCYYSDGSGGTYDSTTSFVGVDGGWHHFQCIMDRDGSEIGTAGLFFVMDGVIQSADTSLTEGSSANASNLTIGETSTATEPTNLTIDNILIYNYARTQSQIAWEYNRGQPVAHYRFDECSGTTLNDSVSNYNESATRHNGTITIGATGPNTSAGTCTGATTEAWKNGVNGKFGASLDFDGTDDYVTISNNAIFNLEGADRTVTGWFNDANANFNHSENTIIIKGDTDTHADIPYYIRVGFNYFSAAFFNSSTENSATYNLSTDDFSVNEWIHFAAVYNVTNSTIQIYLNGTLKITEPGLGYESGGNTGSVQIGNNTDMKYWTGQLDDIRIYNYALTPAQIKTVYNGGSAVQFAPITGSP